MSQPDPPTMTPEMWAALAAAGQVLGFDDGDVIREKGAFAPDFLLVTKGEVDCILSEQSDISVTVGPGAIVGEVGFLTGAAANATLRAKGSVRTLSLDAPALARMREEAPDVAADVLRHVAGLIAARSSENEKLLDGLQDGSDPSITVLRCSTLDQRRMAERLRFDVRYLEGGVPPPDLDAEDGTVRDPLDDTGELFLVLLGQIVVGAGRVHAGGSSGPNETVATLSELILRSAHDDPAIRGELVGALAEYARGIGARTLLTHSPPTDVDAFVASGFVRCGGTTASADDQVALAMELARPA